jgi:hypothetical protein
MRQNMPDSVATIIECMSAQDCLLLPVAISCLGQRNKQRPAVQSKIKKKGGFRRLSVIMSARSTAAPTKAMKVVVRTVTLAVLSLAMI